MRVSLASPVQPETEDNGAGEDDEDGGDGAVHGLKPLRPVAEDEEEADDADLIEKKDPNQAQKQARRFFAPGCGKGQHRRREQENALRAFAAVEHGQPAKWRGKRDPPGGCGGAMFINWKLRELNLKIVYYGPALSGKTTNL